MMLRKINKPSLFFRMPNDIRHHTYGLSRFIYISVLLIISMLLLNYLFYSVYMLTGDAFVDSDAKVLSLEYDGQIEDIYVENGDKVTKNQELFSFDSLEYRSEFLKTVNEYLKIMTKRQEIDVDVEKLGAYIDVSGNYLKSIKEALVTLDRIKKSGNVTLDRYLNEKTREYNASRDFTGYNAELEAKKKAYEELHQIIETSEKTLSYFVNNYAEGNKNSPVAGTVGELSVQPGGIVKKGNVVMKVYYGKRYLSVLFESSFIGKKIGDPVIVYFPNGAHFTTGRIVDIGNFSQELPEEIRPRYRPPGRREVARVLVDAEYLENQDILGTARVYKPVGLNLLCSLLSCKSDLIDKYKEYMNDREIIQKQTKTDRLNQNNYLKNTNQKIETSSRG